jgi:hypothetical protein
MKKARSTGTQIATVPKPVGVGLHVPDTNRAQAYSAQTFLKAVA